MAALCWSSSATAQKFITDKSNVRFFSKATIEDIAAENQKSVSMINVGTGEIAVSIPISEFQFEKSLMKEHFNEKYMESEKFPKATFQGKISGFQASATGPQQVKAEGKLTIHGVSHDVEIPGTIELNGTSIHVQCKFMVKLEDYAVPRPQLLWKNIAEEVEVTIDFTYKPYEK